MSKIVDSLVQIDTSVSSLSENVRIFVIANQDIYVDGLIRLILDDPSHEIVDCVKPDYQCYDRFRNNPADILMIEKTVIDGLLVNTPKGQLFDSYRRDYPDLRIVIFGHEIPDAFVRRMIRAGVHGFIDSETTRDMLTMAIREIHTGGYWVGRKALEQLIYSAVEMERVLEQGVQERIGSIQHSLTRRESDVLQCVLEGMSTREIATDLNLSEQSIKLHLGRLFKKFEVTNRSQLILMAIQRVCPVTNLIQLFRNSVDERRITSKYTPIIKSPPVGKLN